MGADFSHDYPEDGGHEYVTTAHDPYVIGVSKVGGGTIGHAYAGAWHYAISGDDRLIDFGSDLVTGTPHTHAEVAAMVADLASEDR